MRPGQQNRRSRGRNNNRKGPNPLSRNYESNGPDVKIRGSAQHVADKYASLARDAQSSGDRVMAENYLQHAEHYNRIIAAAQAHLAQQAAQENRDNDSPSHAGDDNRDNRDNREGGDGRVGRNGREARDNRNGAQQASDTEAAPAADGSGPQPVIEGTPAEVVFGQDGANGAGTRRPRRRGPAAEASGDDAADSPKPARAPRRNSRAPKAAKPDDSQPAVETPEAAGAADAGPDAPATANQE